MLNLLGALLIGMSSAITGYLVSTSLKNRCSTLRGLVHGIEVLQAEIVFKRSTAEVALRQCSVNATGVVREYFEHIATLLSRGSVVRSAFTDSYVIIKNQGLSREDRELLRNLSGIIGRYDSYEQSLLLKNIKSLMLKQLDDSVEQYSQKGKLYGAIGVSVGLMLALIVV